ncbi:dCTP deaminase [Salinibacter ruber]|jgi:dCTP deaminase|uniref:dCTP deaminase n=3 Tax=Salinibacter ruber TaxID=146919 RepID=Q2S2M4_SALRD|nr:MULTISPECIES: dCTP deaminase [Salinibacter]ABC46024.1 deoxycytidine triphosphate deaminase [Salinibacter ruber DSM 13855]MBB4062243.1 dCTP deaminase [Salinibacter ruber]MBB4068241.1 dCTP deaminase [Salinibacter ruber]MBB4088939.1 dCTP deaminase [Salinibacter ruber]MCS3614134.1 dCTP deaminase [Salinibacter ruber]
MILPDHRIRTLATEHDMIDPFVDEQVREDVVSYGLSSFGYDMRVAGEFRVFTPNVHNSVVDPKRIDERALVEHEADDHILIPPNSYVLGRSIEYFRMPSDTLGLVLGKSTYARSGIIVNVTPLEPGWEGHVTIEIGNGTPLPAKVYAEEGIAQVVFLRGETPEVSYEEKQGKYQSQQGITLPRLE